MPLEPPEDDEVLVPLEPPEDDDVLVVPLEEPPEDDDVLVVPLDDDELVLPLVLPLDEDEDEDEDGGVQFGSYGQTLLPRTDSTGTFESFEPSTHHTS